MGAGASVPEEVDEATARSLAGESFSKERFDKLAAPKGTVSRDDFLAAAKDFGGEAKAHSSAAAGGATTSKFDIGDVVKAKPDGEDLMVEGTVLQIDNDGFITVDFGDNDFEIVHPDNVQKVAQWDALEVGDKVQAQPDGMAIYCDGKVIGMSMDDAGEMLYEVEYDDDGEIEKLPETRIRKVASNRASVVKKWKKTFQAVSTINLLRSLITAKAVGGLAEKMAAAEAAEAKSEPGAAPKTPQSGRPKRVSLMVAMSTTVDADEVTTSAAASSQSPSAPKKVAAGGRASFAGAKGGPPALPKNLSRITTQDDSDDDDDAPKRFGDEEEPEFEIGDIVKCKVDGMFFEGVVVGVGEFTAKNEPACIVELGTEEEQDQQLCAIAEMAKVLPWSHLEVGDRVEAQQDFMWFRATIIKVNMAEGDYDVQYDADPGDDEPEVETHIPEERIRKMQSVRTFVPKEQWQKAKNVVNATRAFRMFALKSVALKAA